ncbi:Uncharacterised protein [Escherichia coli]|nr:Uncharacterised protein [Escherichia coli]CAD6121145.1 Uncharacterised protein [Escherichia coli]
MISVLCFLTLSEWCIIGGIFDISWQGLIMHYPDVVNITK